MKKFLSILMIAASMSVVLFYSTSCKKDSAVTACFNLSADTIKAGDSVIFTSCSQNAGSFEIAFGDGTSYWGDALNKFTHVYSYPGTYTFTNDVFGTNGNTKLFTKNIVVLSSGGTWTFRSYVTAANTCYVLQNSLIGKSASGLILQLTFPSLPTSSGTYTVVTSPPGYNQVALSYTNTVGTYVGGYINLGQTIQVTVAGGKISATGTVTIDNVSNPSDNDDMTFDLEQQ